MSDRSGIDSQKIKRISRALMFWLFAGCFVSMPCFASTNEDLTAPPASEMAAPIQLHPKPEAAPKPQETRVMPSKPEGDAQKQSESNISKPLPSKEPVAQPAQAQPAHSVPKADVAVQKESSVVKEDEKLVAARESVRAIVARAQRRMSESKADEYDSEISGPLLKAMTLEALLLLNDEKQRTLNDTAMPSTAFPVAPSVSDIDLKRIRALLEGGERDPRAEKKGEKEAASSTTEALRPHDIDLRLPPME